MAREDPQTLAAIRAGDPEVLGEIVHKYLKQIERAGRGAGLDAHQAEELAQATSTTFIETAQRFEPIVQAIARESHHHAGDFQQRVARGVETTGFEIHDNGKISTEALSHLHRAKITRATCAVCGRAPFAAYRAQENAKVGRYTWM